MTQTIDSIAAGITTVAQGRAALGKAAELLRDGYTRLGDIPTSVFSDDDVRAAVQSLLDQANAYAQKIYGQLPSDDESQGQMLDDQTRQQVSAALHYAQSGLDQVQDAANTVYWDFPGAIQTVLAGVGSALGTVGSVAGKVAGAAGSGIFGGLGLFWTLAIVAVALVLFAPGLVRKAIP